MPLFSQDGAYSSLLIQKGLSENMAGRFFLYMCTHWGFLEIELVFSWNIDKWLFFGGYPGAAPFIDQEDVWNNGFINALTGDSFIKSSALFRQD